MANHSSLSFLNLPFNDKLYEIRKELHKIPELAFTEYKTHEFILKILQNFPELKLHTFPFPGLIAEYSQGEGDYILFRADMDALPVIEKTNCDFTSLHKGMMHACGHDIHMTILLGLIEDVIKAKIYKNILFLFQPAEEGQGGAIKVIESGILQKFRIKEVYALHVNPDLPVDTVSSCSGVFFGIPQEFDVVFKGKSAHAANPQKGNDAILSAAAFIKLLPAVISKSFSPDSAILAHIGKISGGTARNIVADICIVEGTLRAFNKVDMDLLKDLLINSARHSTASFNVEAEVKLLGTYDSVVNSPILYEKLKLHLPSGVKFKEAAPALTGEDFGFLTSMYDGLLFWIGADGNSDLHSSYFLPDEKAIKTGLNVFKQLLVN